MGLVLLDSLIKEITLAAVSLEVEINKKQTKNQ